MQRRLRDLSIKTKLVLLAAASGCVTVVLCCFGFAINDVRMIRQAKVKELQVQADLLSFNSTAVLTFRDAPAAKRLIESLEAFSFSPGGRGQRHVAQVLANQVFELGLTVKPQPLPGDISHAIIPELNRSDYDWGGDEKTAIKEWALQLAHRCAEMVLLVDDSADVA